MLSIGIEEAPVLPGLRWLAALAVTPHLIADRPAEVPLGTFQYAVTHPTFGEIGTYTNTVQRTGADITVDTHLHIAVAALVIPLRRIDADREEVWRDGRLVAFRSYTDHDGRKVPLQGWAAGDKFVIDGPRGRTDAPADLFPTNPWSIAITGARLLMGTETGRLLHVQFAEAPAQVLAVAGRRIETKHFVASGEQQAQLWYDSQGIPVKFTIVHDGDDITFQLENVQLAAH